MNLELRRRLMVGTIDRGLPSDYQQVEYIESSGTQYIKLPTLQYCVNFYLRFQLVEFISRKWLFGDNTKGRAIEVYSEKNSYGKFIYCCFSSWNKIYTTSKIDEITEVKIEDKMCYVNNVYKDTLTSTEGHWGNPYLFSCVGYHNPIKARVFALGAEDNMGNKVNFIPCYRKADNLAGIYDIVNNQFYTNAGTGEFLVGPDVD